MTNWVKRLLDLLGLMRRKQQKSLRTRKRALTFVQKTRNLRNVCKKNLQLQKYKLLPVIHITRITALRAYARAQAGCTWLASLAWVNV